MTAISIRQAQDKDATTVASLVHALLDELSGGNAPELSEVTRSAKAVLPAANVVAAIAWVEGEAVGVMTLNECAAIYAGGKFGEICELYVRPDMRSKGVAHQLVEHAQREARARGWTRIEVGAPRQPDWHRTLNFYLRNGFDEIGPRLRCLL
ncbi:GNAT family N-acetyltransferase [Maritalea mobilis]|nr:GNAT family N-acetyltransferase [Maritalea mobilis]